MQQRERSRAKKKTRNAIENILLCEQQQAQGKIKSNLTHSAKFNQYVRNCTDLPKPGATEERERERKKSNGQMNTLYEHL